MSTVPPPALAHAAAAPRRPIHHRWVGLLLVFLCTAAIAFVIHPAVSMNDEPPAAVVDASGEEHRWDFPPGMGEMGWERVFSSAGR